MSKFNPVIANTESQYQAFKEAVFQSGDDAKLQRLFSAHALYGKKTKRIVVLPGGWESIMASDKTLITAFAARNNISIYNVTQSKLDTFAELLEQEKANAEAKAYPDRA